jgi:hypothetical protein
MTINKFSNDIPDKPFHSHTFAEAASGQSMGSTNAQSFGKRHQIDQNRQVVRRYSESAVASSGEHLREEINKRIDNGLDQKHHAKHTYRSTRQGFNAGVAPGVKSTQNKPSVRPVQVPKRNFSEPSPRKYNPFS